MTARTRYFVVSSLLVLFVGLGSCLVAYYRGFPAGLFTSSGGPGELKYIPRHVSLVACADVQEVMASQWRQRLLQIAPDQESARQRFQEQTGINIETDIQHVVASIEPNTTGGTSGSGIVLARGVFNEVQIEALMREHGAQVVS